MISVNGQPSAAADGQTVAELLVSMGLDPAVRGVAVAVDGCVLPRSEWPEHRLRSDARVEVLAAMQGG